MKAALRKSPIAKNVDFNFIAKITDGFSGADMSEICQRAAKSAVKESIEAEERLKKAVEMNPDQATDYVNYEPVPEITRKHFEEALRNVPKSVKPEDL